MARYGLRSGGSVSTTEVANANAAGTSKGAGRKQPAKKRTRSVQRTGSKKADAVEALKKKQKGTIRVADRTGQAVARAKINKHVYIGNLPQGATEEMLRGHFKQCGRIGRTILRMSTGVMGGSVRAGVLEGPVRNRYYASMEFGQREAALNALGLHDSVLAGARLVVVSSPGDLPEVSDAAEMMMATMAQRKVGKKGGAGKPVRSTTERDFSDPVNDRMRIWGISFVKTVV